MQPGESFIVAPAPCTCTMQQTQSLSWDTKPELDVKLVLGKHLQIKIERDWEPNNEVPVAVLNPVRASQ